MLDFSLQLRFLPNSFGRSQPCELIARTYHHLIYDTLRGYSVAHDLIAEMLPEMQSALLIYDQGGGNAFF